ncbi:MAG: S-layer homology domain-containing protein [Anaerovoracaceae bacterium]|jgi:hypothetical protein
MSKKMHRLATAVLAIAMTAAVAAAPVTPVFSGLTNSNAYAATTTFSDISGHWAKAYITKAVSLGIVSGYPDGTFRPDNSVSRAEFTHMLNAALGNTGTEEPSFSDITSSEWYYNDVCKSVAAGYIAGYEDGTFRPVKTITRQEAAAIIARIVPAYGSEGDLSKFSDASSVADWAETSMEKMVGKGYISGSDGKLNPESNLTRAEAVKIIVDIVEGENIISKNQTIVQTGVTIKDTIYSNQISVGSAVGDGNAKFDNCTVLGNINVQGGGNSSSECVQLINTRASKVTVNRDDDAVRVLAKGESTVLSTYVEDSAILEEESLSTGGGFGNGFVDVYMERKSDLTLQADIDTLEMLGAKCDATLSDGASAETVNIDEDSSRSDLTVEEGASAGTVNVNGESTAMHGKGTVNTINANADSLTYESEPGTMNIGSNVTVKPVLNVDPSEALTITVTPSDGSTDISVSDNIEVKFSSAVHATGSDQTTLTDVQAQSLILLKKDDSTGENIPCTVTVNNNGAGVTIDPEGTLAHGTTYYVRIGNGDLTDAYGNTNDLFISGFTTTGTRQDTAAELNSLEVGVTDGGTVDYSTMSTDADASNVYYIGTQARTINVKISTLIPSPVAEISLNTDVKSLSQSEGSVSFVIPAGTGDPGTIEIKLSSTDGDYAETTYKVTLVRLTTAIKSASIQGSSTDLNLFDSLSSAQSANADTVSVSGLSGSLIELVPELQETANSNAVSVSVAKYDADTSSWTNVDESTQTDGAWTLGTKSSASSASGIYRITTKVNVCGSSSVNGSQTETAVKYLNLSFS